MKSGAVLTLIGKVDKNVVKNLVKSKAIEKGNNWFFVDYANDEVRVGELFDTLLEGRQKTLIPGETKIKLKKVYDQLGHYLDYVPEGFQTICKFDFDNKLPAPINKLPTFETWDYNPNSISIANHQLIQLSEPDFIYKKMNALFIVAMRKHIHSQKSTITTQELRDFFKKKYLMQDPKEILSLLNMWKIMGLVKEKKNQELELVAEENDTP